MTQPSLFWVSSLKTQEHLFAKRYTPLYKIRKEMLMIYRFDIKGLQRDKGVWRQETKFGLVNIRRADQNFWERMGNIKRLAKFIWKQARFSYRGSHIIGKELSERIGNSKRWLKKLVAQGTKKFDSRKQITCIYSCDIKQKQVANNFFMKDSCCVSAFCVLIPI